MKIAFYKGRTRLFNRFVSWWTSGPYSHVEAVFDGFQSLDAPVLCASSSFMDGGVRMKMIELTPAHWDILDIPAIDSTQVCEWFHKHVGCRYDLVGLLSTSCPIKQDRDRFFCNEAIGTASGLRDAWRFNPNSFARICELLGGVWVQGGPNGESHACLASARLAGTH
ncbi:hypothetical protein [Noviherbaspirillum sp. ST 5-3]